MLPCLLHSARTLGLAAVLAAAGCAGVAPPVRPDRPIDVPSQWDSATRAEATAPPEVAFGDPVLARLVAMALEADAGAAAARARMAQARALYDAAAAAWWPAVDLSASLQRGAGGAVPRRAQAGLDASWRADGFGAVGHDVAAAAAQARAAEMDLGAVRVELAATVALDYLQLCSAQARLALAHESIAAQAQTMQISQWRAEAGLVAALDVAQAQAALERTRAQLPALQALAATSRHALAVLTGRSPAAVQALAGPAAELPVPPDDAAAALPGEVLRRRPDVAAAEQRLVATAEQAARADAQRRPSLHLDIALAWAAADLGSLGSVAAARALVLAGSVPLIDGGRLAAEHRAALAAHAEAQAAYRARVLAALQDVDDTLVALAAARDRTAALGRAERAAREAAELAAQRYAGGVIDFLAVLDTQRTLLDVRDALAVAQADRAAGHVRLYRAVGGSWHADAGARQ